jgi:hypothetical protein
VPSFTTQVANLQAVGPAFQLHLALTDMAQEAVKKAGGQVPPPVSLLAMIDTGASRSVIQQGLAAKLGLQPIGVVHINTPSHVNVPCYEYPLRLLFPSNVIVEGVVIEAPLQGQHIQCLIGRDVLQQGVLVYIGYTNQFTLSF